MALIKVTDLAYGRLRAPDLDLAEEFLLGSQIYDYWTDPWGRVHEHWSDTDRLNVKNGSNLISAEEGLVSQWGERPPQKFLERVCP